MSVCVCAVCMCACVRVCWEEGGDCVYPLVTSDVIYSFAELILMLIVMFC